MNGTPEDPPSREVCFPCTARSDGWVELSPYDHMRILVDGKVVCDGKPKRFVCPLCFESWDERPANHQCGPKKDATEVPHA